MEVPPWFCHQPKLRRCPFVEGVGEWTFHPDLFCQWEINVKINLAEIAHKSDRAGTGHVPNGGDVVETSAVVLAWIGLAVH